MPTALTTTIMNTFMTAIIIAFIPARTRGTTSVPARRFLCSTYEGTCWDERFCVQGMEGPVLSGKAQGRGDARLLFRQVSRRRDQQHVLSAAEGEDAARLGRQGARELPVRDQGLTANHTLHPAQARIGGSGGLFAEDGGGARFAARPHPLPVASEHETR